MSSNIYRPSASVIMAVKKLQSFDYHVIIFKRTQSTSYAPKHCVFPGGVFDSSADECHEWLQHFFDMGITQAQLDLLVLTTVTRPQPLLTDGVNLPRDISLRLTAIRETFEEVGILLCVNQSYIRDGHNIGLCVSAAQVHEDFDCKTWQKRVHEDPHQFLKLCQYLKVVPDLWSLYEWSAWRSPATLKKKYDTVFYFAALEHQPNMFPEPTEVEIIIVQPVKQLLQEFKKGNIWLPPVQFYELSRLNCVDNWTHLIEFSYKRNKKGCTLLLPVYYRCEDGIIGTLPGDDFYPHNLTSLMKSNEISMTVNKFQELAVRLHRYIIYDMNKMEINVNIAPLDEHIIINRIMLIDSKL